MTVPDLRIPKVRPVDRGTMILAAGLCVIFGLGLLALTRSMPLTLGCVALLATGVLVTSRALPS
ncbi:hypothetical protein ACWDSJ_12115 [Nocardia sp. NPDC003482]|uniref:hypothetical protein n=1 Tax=Nocardia sp. NPDC004068 TaxID=3364303 RepID=UPI0036A4863A